MMLNDIKPKRSFTLIELLISLTIIVIVSGALIALKGPFSHRRTLMDSALKLVNDLRLTQQFSRGYKGEYKYYGLRFYANLGPDKCEGYKIVRYNPPGVDVSPPVPDLDNLSIIKTSEEDDMASGTVEFVEDTFFAKRVEMDTNSEFQVGGTGWPNWPAEKPNAIVFTPKGSATVNGQDLLDSNYDHIILRMGKYSVTIEIAPLTGYIRIL